MAQDSKFREIWSQILPYKRSLVVTVCMVCIVFVSNALIYNPPRTKVSQEDIVSAQSVISKIERDIGITVKYNTPYTLADGSPVSLPGISLTYDPPDFTFLPVIARGLEKAVLPYPPSFLQKYCGLVFMTGKLEIDDIEVAGTYGPKWIIISASQGLHFDMKFRETKLNRTFHHECASQVYTTDAWAILGFTSFFPADFVAAQNIRDLVAEAGKPAPDPSTGYLNAYATTGPSNDFSEYAEFIFAQPEQMRDLASQHPKVREKLNMVLAIYERADPLFKAYFDAHGLSDINK